MYGLFNQNLVQNLTSFVVASRKKTKSSKKNSGPKTCHNTSKIMLKNIHYLHVKDSRFQKVSIDIWVLETSNQVCKTMQGYTRLYYARLLNINRIFEKSSYWQHSVLCNRSILHYPFYFSWHWLLTEQFYMEMLRF